MAEFALTVLLSGLAIVLHQEIRRLGRVDLGFDPTDVVGIQITLPKTGYSTPQRRRAFYSEVLAGAVGWSGGKTAAIGEVLAEGGPRFTFEQAEPVGHVEPRAALVIPVSSGFFDVISASLRPGEGAARGVRGAVVGRKIADHYWGSQQVVGRRIRFGGDQPGWWTVVGVVDDIRHGGPTAEAPPTIYLDLWHLPPLETMLLVRSTGGTQPAIAAALALLRRIDDDVVVGEAGPLSSLLEARNEPLRLAAVLAAVLAVVGLAMAGAGVLGVFSLGAHQRLKALAIRSALGAEGRHLVGVLLYEACLVCGLGVVMGSLLAGGAHHVGARLWPGHSIPLLVPVGLGSGMAALAVLLSSLNMLRAAAAVDPARLLRRT